MNRATPVKDKKHRREGRRHKPPKAHHGKAAESVTYSRETPQEAARAAHLRYVSDRQPGIRRERKGKGEFRYRSAEGEKITDEKTLERIRSLGIPPAYKNVWICPIANGHIQATGRDARGRKQYRYHPRWRALRDETKYGRMIAFGDALPRLRERVDHDLALPGLQRPRVLATLVRLLEETRIRIGNEEYAQTNQSYGLTTLRSEHVDITGTKLHFHFRGKSGKRHAIDIRDARVARVVRRLQDLEGQELFQYVDSQTGETHTITSGDVNAYLREITGEDFTAKDFRTWAGTVLCALDLASRESGESLSETQARKNIVQAVKNVAERLGNTPAICRKCYIHPAVLEAYTDGSLAEAVAARGSLLPDPATVPGGALTPGEKAVLTFLRHCCKDG